MGTKRGLKIKRITVRHFKIRDNVMPSIASTAAAHARELLRQRLDEELEKAEEYVNALKALRERA